jgi:hypothetical protein
MAETQTTPSEAIREFYKDELAAGTLSEPDLARLQQIAEERFADFSDWGAGAGPALKAELLDALADMKPDADALKEANADGVISGEELAEHGQPIAERLIEMDEVIDAKIVEGAHVVLDASREIVEARAEMDGADPEVIQTQLETIERAEAEVDDFHAWRQEQRDQAIEMIDAKMDEIRDVEDVRDLPPPPPDAEADIPIVEA